MKRAAHWLGSSVLIAAMCHCALAQGTSIEELQAFGHLQIDATLTPDEGIVPGQRVRLTLAVATNTWFTGGTQIGIPEVPGLVILQTEQFASNASEVRNGQTWVIQRWTLDVFPQRAGDFTIAPLPLQLQVNAGEQGDVKGETHSPGLHFSVAVPESLTTAEHWVSAPEFTVSQSFDKPLGNLVTGDAFEQEVVFEALDVLAMMLPTYVVEHLTGLAAYPSPPELNNSVNRGEAQARRSMRVSYVVEQPGQYLLPARDYYWWNTQRGELELLSLPETRINVIGKGVAAKANSVSATFSPKLLLLAAIGLVVLAVALRLAYLYLPRLRGSTQLSGLARRWRNLRKPALASQLNPGSSAEG